jgi:hypothetical protein
MAASNTSRSGGGRPCSDGGERSSGGREARWATATILLQGQHYNHAAKVTAFAVFRVCVTERVKHIGYLLREGLGNVEVVAADVEEGAVVTEAVLEVGQVVIDAVEGTKPPDKAGGDLLAESQ